jgi:hypothetical protein
MMKVQIYVIEPVGNGSGGVAMVQSGSGRSGGTQLNWLVKVNTIVEGTDYNVSVV